MIRAWLVLGLLIFAQIGNGESRCLGGGDGGGVPFSLVPENAAAAANYVKTKSLVYDFLFWENTNRILYVDQWENYRQHDSANAVETVLFGSDVTAPFSRTIDPGNRYFTNWITGVVFDTQQGSIRNIPYNSKQKELFWNDSVLYSIPAASMNSGVGLQTIYAYDAKKGRLNWCSVKTNGFYFNPAIQNSFPYLDGFESTPIGNGQYRVRSLRIDVRNALSNHRCHIEGVDEYKDLFPGAVMAMHHYGKLGANVFVLDNPRKQILWDLGKNECIFYNLEGQNFTVLKSEVPVIALWSREHDLNILYPRRTQRRSFADFGQFGFSQLDFALSNNGRKLYVSQKPEANSGSLKMLFQFELDEVP